MTRPLPPQPLLLIVLAGLGMVGPFTIDTIFPAFGRMGADLGVSELALQQLLSVYMLAFAFMSLFHGPLSDALGRKPVVLVGVLVFAAASAGAAVAPDLPTLLVMRAVQGASAGAGQIISRAMVSDLFERSLAQRVMSHIAMIFGLAPALAPIVGGWILAVGHWRSIFWFLCGFGLMLALLVLVLLPESHPPEDRSPLRLGPLAAGLWGVWTDRDGRRLALAGMFNFAGMFTYIASASLFVVGLLNGGEQDFWVLFVPLIGGMVTGSWFTGRMAGRIGGGRLATIGYVISSVGAVGNLALALAPGTQGLPWSVLFLPVYSFGIAIVFPILTLEMLELFPHARGSASSVQSFLQLLFNSLIAGVIAPFVAQSLPGLAVAALVFTAIGWAGWTRHLVMTHREPPTTPDAPAYEPLEDL